MGAEKRFACVPSSDMQLPPELLWRIFYELGTARQIICARHVCEAWRAALDDVTQSQWREFYHRRVCDSLVVSVHFDWRRAALVAMASNAPPVQAWCTWNNRRVSITAPWSMSSGVEVPLRDGVTRRMVPGVGHVEFVYDGEFRLRGVCRSCATSRAPCVNCRLRSKRPCLRPVYHYYIRRIPPARDDRLGMWLCASSA